MALVGLLVTDAHGSRTFTTHNAVRDPSRYLSTCVERAQIARQMVAPRAAMVHGDPRIDPDRSALSRENFPRSDPLALARGHRLRDGFYTHAYAVFASR